MDDPNTDPPASIVERRAQRLMVPGAGRRPPVQVDLIHDSPLQLPAPPRESDVGAGIYRGS